jgi:predicted NBD/HSP70 family sugar kinase
LPLAPRGARPGSRTTTLRPVLDALLTRGPLTLEELQAESGVSRTTLKNHTCPELRRERWLEEREAGLIALGPKAQVLALTASRERVRAALVDGHGDVLEEAQKDALIFPFHTKTWPPPRVQKTFAAAATECMQKSGRARPAAVALSWPGQISRTAGGPASYARPENGWSDGLRLDDLLKNALASAGLKKVPISLVNDADAELLGECRFGVAQDAKRVLGVKLSGGVGSAIVINKEVYESEDGTVGEIGHVPVELERVDDDGHRPLAVKPLADLRSCSCGVENPHHLEQFACGRASLERLYKPADLQAGYDDPASRLVADAREVVHVLGGAGTLVGRALVAPWLVLEPDAVVVMPRPYSEAVSEGAKTALREVVGKLLDVRTGTSPDDGGDLMAARGAAAYAFTKHVRPALQRRVERR